LLKRRLFWGLMVVLLLAGPVWASAAPDQAGSVTVSYDFQWIRQGRVGIVRVTGPDVAEVRAVFQGRVYHFYPEDNGFTGLISADMNSDIEPYTMQVWVKHDDGSTERVDKDIDVESGEFGSWKGNLSASLIPLLEPDVETAEMDRLFNIMDRFTPERYWEQSGFISDSIAEEIGWFGTWRLFNDTYWKRHTGIDVRVPVGTPVTAIADGRVMLAEDMAIRGGYILIDHGWGIYSGYAHLSQKLVVPGQWVRQGDVIALSGNNGRAAGAHLHWEIAVGGVFVDPDDFVAMGLGGSQ
jgi:hypothetical protein